MSVTKNGRPDEHSIKVMIAYEDSEVSKAIAYYILRIQNMRLYALMAVPIIIVSIILSRMFAEIALLLIVFLFAGCILYYLYYKRPIDGYLKFYRKRSGGQYSFNNDCVCVVGNEIQSRYLWSVFKKAYDIPSAFLLMDDNQFIYVFPKSCFDDIQSIEQLHDLLIKRYPDLEVHK